MIRFNHRRLASVAVVLWAASAACDPESSDSENEFREDLPEANTSVSGGYAVLSGANVAADGPFALFTGEDTNSLGCLTYTIGGDQPITPVGQRRMDGTYAPDLLVVGDEFSLEGTVRCRVFAHPTVPDSYVLEEADGTPLFTVRGPYVFDGMIDLPPNNTPEFQKLLYTELAFSLQGPGVYEGPYWQGEVLATATVSDLRMATPRRRLLLAALTDGVCGAIGLHVMVPVP